MDGTKFRLMHRLRQNMRKRGFDAKNLFFK